MPSREDVYYFGAGPAPLPTPVLEDAAKALLNYNNMGYGLAEMSHRSLEANRILADAKDALTELLDVPVDYEILFLQGGGSGEFSASVYYMVNLWVQRQLHWAIKNISEFLQKSGEDQCGIIKDIVKDCLRLDYIVTGSWSLKASQEAAKLVGPEHVRVITDARTHNNGKFGVIPPESSWQLQTIHSQKYGTQAKQPALTYFCDNETVDGVEFPAFPKCCETSNPVEDCMVVADMSSNFISKKVDISKYAVIFGGAQKNVGTTGITIVILRKSLLPPQAAQAPPDLMRYLGLPIGPVVLDWATIAKNNSLYNTLPIFDVWIAGQVMARLGGIHGAKKISGQENVANEKARLIYHVLDSNPQIYKVVPEKKVRSRMNICLRILGDSTNLEESFLKGAKERGLLGLKGHRSVGGIRISNYNAVPVEGVRKLVHYLETFVESSATGA